MYVYVQINVTPDKRKKLDEDEVVAILAPFNAFPKVCFESIKLSSTASRDVILRNPNKNALTVSIYFVYHVFIGLRLK